MNLISLLQQQGLKSPQTPALIESRHHSTRFTSYFTLDLASARLASFLVSQGLKPGDRVLIFYPISAELYITLAAVFRLGLVAMFVDPGVGQREIDRCCHLYPPQAFIGSCQAHLLPIFYQSLGKIPLKVSLNCCSPWRKLSPDRQIFPCTPETPALLTFTSGSTGKPKAVLRSHGFLWAQYQALTKILDYQVGEVELATLPIFILANLAAGISSLIPPGNLRFPGKIVGKRVVKQILTQQPERCLASPGFLERIIDYCLDRGLILPSLQKIFVGGAPLMAKTLEELEIIAPNAKITVVYGATEVEPIATVTQSAITPQDRDKMRQGKGLLVGKPVESLQVKVIKFSDNLQPDNLNQAEFGVMVLPVLIAGEIVVSGAHVLGTYLDGDWDSKLRVNHQIWHRTGDAGYFDLEGRLWLLGRCQARLEDVEGVLYPLGVECVVKEVAGVKRSTVISWRGKRVLLVELKRGKKVNLEALKMAVPWAKIEEVLIAKIPVDRRHNAKIDYPTLAKQLRKFNGCL